MVFTSHFDGWYSQKKLFTCAVTFYWALALIYLTNPSRMIKIAHILPRYTEHLLLLTVQRTESISSILRQRQTR
jgi:hypothetical protein